MTEASIVNHEERCRASGKYVINEFLDSEFLESREVAKLVKTTGFTASCELASLCMYYCYLRLHVSAAEAVERMRLNEDRSFRGAVSRWTKNITREAVHVLTRTFHKIHKNQQYKP